MLGRILRSHRRVPTSPPPPPHPAPPPHLTLSQPISPPSLAPHPTPPQVCVRPLHSKPGAPYAPGIAELLRRFVSEAMHNVQAVLSLAFVIHTGTLPKEENMINNSLVPPAFSKLGIMDREARVGRNKADPHMKSIAGDTGADKTKSQYHGAMELIAMCSWALDQSGPICEPIACTDLGGDQSARQGKAAYTAAIEREGITADKLSSLETDNTDHARMTLEGVVATLDPATCRAIIEGCYRHLTVLEEKAAMDAAFPDEEVINYLRCFWEVLHAQPIYYEQMWLVCRATYSFVTEPVLGEFEERAPGFLSSGWSN